MKPNGMYSLAASRLRAVMGEKGITQKRLANELGVSVPKVANLMSGWRAWTLEDLRAVSQSLGVPKEYFVSEPVDVVEVAA